MERGVEKACQRTGSERDVGKWKVTARRKNTLLLGNKLQIPFLVDTQ
jgi:hypothetical protein